MTVASRAVGLTIDQWHRYWLNGDGPIVGATTPLKLQDVMIPGDLATWGGTQAVNAILDGRPWNGADDQAIRDVAMARVARAKNIGTAVHDEIAALLLGNPRPPAAPDVAPYLWSWTKFLNERRPEFLAVEQRIVHPRARYAGTFDFLATIDGRVTLGDVKTGRFKTSMTLQLAAYSMGLMGDEGTADLRPMPRIRQYAVLLLRPDGYELRPLTVTQADRRHYLKLVQAYHQIRGWEDDHESG